MASYSRDKFTLSVTIVSKNKTKTKKKNENVSVWLRKTFTNSYWQTMKCLCQCCGTGTCQNYDHIRAANWKTKRLQHRCYLVRKQLEDFLCMNLWSPIPCYFSQGFESVFWKTIHVLAFFSTTRFCCRIKIFNHFIGTKHKVTETFFCYIVCLLNHSVR